MAHASHLWACRKLSAARSPPETRSLPPMLPLPVRLLLEFSGLHATSCLCKKLPGHLYESSSCATLGYIDYCACMPACHPAGGLTCATQSFNARNICTNNSDVGKPMQDMFFIIKTLLSPAGSHLRRCYLMAPSCYYSIGCVFWEQGCD